MAGGEGPVVAVTDFMRSVPDQVSRWIPRDYTSLGTDGYGHSDTRERLREHFEVTAEHLVVTVLSRLAATGSIPISRVADAIEAYGLATDLPDPWDSGAY